ncbi:MAG: META domain-containing protein [Spirochaetaceae bacterium]|jgi:hypothetical protein|nr:META domain-containing protein [Spirochaetaceae bacterium]
MKKIYVVYFCAAIYLLLMSACSSSQKRMPKITDLPPEEPWSQDAPYNESGYPLSDGSYPPPGGGYSSGGYYQQPNYTNSGKPIDAIKGRIWQLVDIRVGYGLIVLDRQMMEGQNLKNAYIIQFTDDGVNGEAAPNRYFAPYKQQDGYNVKIQQILGTYMMSNINVGGLMENEYYWYLQRIYEWRIVNGLLELYAEPPNPNPEQGQPPPIVLRYRAE